MRHFCPFLPEISLKFPFGRIIIIKGAKKGKENPKSPLAKAFFDGIIRPSFSSGFFGRTEIPTEAEFI